MSESIHGLDHWRQSFALDDSFGPLFIIASAIGCVFPFCVALNCMCIWFFRLLCPENNWQPKTQLIRRREGTVVMLVLSIVILSLAVVFLWAGSHPKLLQHFDKYNVTQTTFTLDPACVRAYDREISAFLVSPASSCRLTFSRGVSGLLVVVRLLNNVSTENVGSARLDLAFGAGCNYQQSDKTAAETSSLISLFPGVPSVRLASIPLDPTRDKTSLIKDPADSAIVRTPFRHEPIKIAFWGDGRVVHSTSDDQDVSSSYTGHQYAVYVNDALAQECSDALPFARRLTHGHATHYCTAPLSSNSFTFTVSGPTSASFAVWSIQALGEQQARTCYTFRHWLVMMTGPVLLGCLLLIAELVTGVCTRLGSLTQKYVGPYWNGHIAQDDPVLTATRAIQDAAIDAIRDVATARGGDNAAASSANTEITALHSRTVKKTT